ncbi:pilin [Lentzea sp. NPDC004789]
MACGHVSPDRAQNGIAERTPRRTRRGRLIVLAAELVVVALLATSSVARAQSVQVVALAQTLDEVLTNIRNWLMGILAALATVFFTVGGVRRIFGAGDPGEQEKSKDCFKAAAWGYGLAALAPLIVTVLKGIVGA